MQADSRVGRRRALPFLTVEDESSKSSPQSYPIHFRRKVEPENKRKFNLWVIEKSFTLKIGSKLAAIRSNNESNLSLKSQTKKKAKF